MYRPKAFREDRPEVLHDLIREYPLATIVTRGAAGLVATHAPVVLDAAKSSPGRLRGHVARGNDHWRAMAEAGQALVIFNGPQAYVSPSLYPSKAEHGRVVPTWNYVAVHVWGAVRVFDEPTALRPVVEALTQQQEAPREQPWSVADAPDDYIDGMLKAIVGLK